MSAQNTPSQRPVQHNPYATTPPMGPRAAPSQVSPPAPPDLRSSPGASLDGIIPSQPGVVGARFSGHHPDGNTPRGGSVPTFMGGGYNGYSMYVATPQHNPQNAGPTIPARMSPGPALGPSAAALASLVADTRAAASAEAPPSYESLVGRVSPHPSSGSSNNGPTGGHQSVFGSMGGSGGWSVAAAHGTGYTPSSHYGSYGSSANGEEKLTSNIGGRFSLHEQPDHASRQPPLRFGGDDALPLLMQGVPRLTPYTQPSYQQQQQQSQQATQGGNGGHTSHHHVSGSNAIPSQMPTAGSAPSSNGPRPGASAHVFLMHKLRYVPLSPEFFVQQPRHHQQQHMMGAMMQPDRPIQMFNGRGRPLQDFCPTADLFVAQLPFNMELTALQYLFDMVSQVPADIIHAAPHYKRGRSYDGCAFVKVSQNVAAILVDTFHKAALFDEEGVWVADTAEQRSVLANYCGYMQQKSPQERRALLRKPIPFSAMTVEFANRSYAF